MPQLEILTSKICTHFGILIEDDNSLAMMAMCVVEKCDLFEDKLVVPINVVHLHRCQVFFMIHVCS